MAKCSSTKQIIVTRNFHSLNIAPSSGCGSLASDVTNRRPSSVETNALCWGAAPRNRLARESVTRKEAWGPTPGISVRTQFGSRSRSLGGRILYQYLWHPNEAGHSVLGGCLSVIATWVTMRYRGPKPRYKTYVFPSCNCKYRILHFYYKFSKCLLCSGD